MCSAGIRQNVPSGTEHEHATCLTLEKVETGNQHSSPKKASGSWKGQAEAKVVASSRPQPGRHRRQCAWHPRHLCPDPPGSRPGESPGLQACFSPQCLSGDTIVGFQGHCTQQGTTTGGVLNSIQRYQESFPSSPTSHSRFVSSQSKFQN